MSPKNEHSRRWKTALVLLAVIAAVGLADKVFITWLFLGIIYALALNEAMRLFQTQEDYLYLYAAGLWILAPFVPHPSDLIFGASLLFAGRLAYNKAQNLRSLFPLLYPSAGILFLWMLYQEFGMLSLFWILAIVALSDVGAYYCGKKFGKTPFSPSSPNKTLEGVFGGIGAGTLGGTWLLAAYTDLSLYTAFVIALLSTISSIFGDLFESYLKREAGLKDSGTLLPGHGGILDRIDGYLFASVALYILLKIAGA